MSLKQIQVTAVDAKDLMNMDTFSLSDPYLIVTIGDQQWRTTTKKNTLAPTWNESHVFNGGPVMLLSMKDEDHGKDDDPLGEGVVNLDQQLVEELRRGAAMRTVTLFYKGSPCGTVRLQIKGIFS